MKKWIDKSIYHIFTFTIHKNRPAPLPTCTSRCRSPAGHQKLPTAHGNPNVDFVLSPDSFLKEKNIPSRELTYPTLGKGKSSSKCHFWGDMLVFRGVFQSQVAEFSILSWWLRLGLGVGVGVGVDCVPTPRAPKWSPPLHQDVFDDRHRAPPFARALPGRNVDCLRPPNPWAKNRRKRYRIISMRIRRSYRNRTFNDFNTYIHTYIYNTVLGWKTPLNMMECYVFDPCRTSWKRHVFKTRIHNTTRAVSILRTSLAMLSNFSLKASPKKVKWICERGTRSCQTFLKSSPWRSITCIPECPWFHKQISWDL